jgi:hypothetical protein
MTGIPTGEVVDGGDGLLVAARQCVIRCYARAR